MSTSEDRVKLVIETEDKFSRSNKKYSAQLNTIGSQADRAGVKTKKLSSGMGMLSKALPTIAVGLLAKNIYSYVKSTNEAIDETYNLHKQTGIAVETLSGLNKVFQLNKANAGDVAGTFNYMTRTIGALEAGGDTAINKFAEFGVQIKDVNGEMRTMEDIFYDSIDALNSIENDVERSAKATQLFGRSAGNLASVIKQGSVNLREQAKEAKRLGQTFDEDAAKKAEKFNDTLLNLESSLSGIARSIVTEVSPALTTIFETMQSIFNSPSEKTFKINYVDKDGNIQSASKALTKGDQELIRTTGQTDMSLVGGDSPLQADLGLARELGVSLQELREYRIAINEEEKKSVELSEKKAKLTELEAIKTAGKTKGTKGSSGSIVAGKEIDYQDIVKAKQEEHNALLDELYSYQSRKYDVELAQAKEVAELEREIAEESELFRLSGSDRELKLLEREFEQKKAMYVEYNGDILALESEYQARKTEIVNAETERQKSTTEANQQKEKQVFDMKVQQAEAYTSAVVSLANLAVSGDKKSAKEKKKIATMEAIMYGGLTQAKVWSQWGYPAGIPWSIGALAMTGANIATIQKANFSNGGLVQSSSQYGDNTSVNVNDGEYISTKQDTAYLTNFLKTRSMSNGGGATNNIYIQGNYGQNEKALARLTVTGINQATKTNQPNRIL